MVFTARQLDVAEMMTWDEAKRVIERTGPASYHWYEHPDQPLSLYPPKSRWNCRKYMENHEKYKLFDGFPFGNRRF